MKKFIIIAAVLALAPFTSFASTTATTTPNAPGCSVPPDHGVYSYDGTQLVNCITNAAWDAAMAAQQHGVALPVFKFPAVVTDKYGITYDCASWMMLGCVDATKTPEYDTYIRGLGHELVSKGYTAADWPRFAGVINAVR